MIFEPEHSTPIASITLTTQVHAMCWGKTSIQEGRRISLFCLTEKREIIQIVEGESGLKMVNEKEEIITAFDEVFDVDKVEERASALKKAGDYSRLHVFCGDL